MDALQQSNRRILFNLLPSHVATHFLDNNSRTHLELYHQVSLASTASDSVLQLLIQLIPLAED